MSTRKCWTCNTEHDLDEACAQAPVARAERAAGGSNGLLFGGAPKPPVITASFDGECSTGDFIFAGDFIRADGDGGWIHEECSE